MSTDPQIRQVEKMMEKEAKADQKTLSHAIKDLTGVEKNHDKSIKAADKAQHALDKAIKQEYNAAATLNKATHAHDSAVSSHHAAEKTLNLKQQHETRLLQDLEQRRADVENLKQRKATNDVASRAQVHSEGPATAPEGGPSTI
ncbi:hypothetical protein NLI96_g9983 [Meripilus lineatus]|uniref:Uncharacterized protein n=1 Tax=Meripilus lineatus TaxID=2056292 RepID=A0AAD5UUG6_9APHY|nr:hypothetical protein NLI96_g9983 [Physisporinus lineatus]